MYKSEINSLRHMADDNYSILLRDKDALLLAANVLEKISTDNDFRCGRDNEFYSINKYRWHDLRKNQQDLPQVVRSMSYTPYKHRKEVNIIIALENGEYRCCDAVSIGSAWSPRKGLMENVFTFETSDSYFYPVVDPEDFEYKYQSRVLAWREIEPLEVEE